MPVRVLKRGRGRMTAWQADPSVETYLAYVAGNSKPPSPEEERRLTTVVEDAINRCTDEIMTAQPLSTRTVVGKSVRDDVFGHFKRHGIADACAAAEELLRRNQGLVIAVARGYAAPPGATVLDLFQQGNLGLIRAIGRFDLRKGYRFSTYAPWWIRHQIQRWIDDHSQMIRLPVHAHRLLEQIRKFFERTDARLGRMPTDDEIAAEFKLTPTMLKSAMCAYHASGVASLDQPIREREGSRGVGRRLTPADFVSSPAPGPEERLIEAERARTADSLEPLLDAVLDPLDADLLRRHFGLRGPAQTHKEAGAAHGLSREAARQRILRALARLRAQLEGS